MKIYRGEPRPSGAVVSIRYASNHDGPWRALVARRDIFPIPGFDASSVSIAWGLFDRGTLLLSLSLLCDALRDDHRALRSYQQFAFDILASSRMREPGPVAGAMLAWELNDEIIEKAVRNIEARRATRFGIEQQITTGLMVLRMEAESNPSLVGAS